MWSKIWYSIGQFFEYIFEFLPLIGNKINYIYINNHSIFDIMVIQNDSRRKTTQ